MPPRKRTKEGEKGVTAAFAKDISEAAEKSSEHPPAYVSPTPTLGSPNPGGRATQENPGPPIPAVPTPVPEEDQVNHSDVGTVVQDKFGSSIELPAMSQDEVNPPPAVTAPTPLSLQCRTCNAPPTAATQPTVTMCGHLFCSGYVTRIIRNTAARLTPHQVRHTIRVGNFQMSCLPQRPPTVLFIQT